MKLKPLENLNFSSSDNKNFYKVNIDFKPFYFKNSLIYDGISTKNLFR